MLEYTFVLERMARLRIGGSHSSNVMGMEVRGMPLASLFSLSDRSKLGSVLEDVFQLPSVCKIYLEAEICRRKPPVKARMLLLRLRSDLGDVSRILGCFVAQGDLGSYPQRFKISKTKIREFDPKSELETAAQPNVITPLPQDLNTFSTTVQNGTLSSRAPYLRLIKIST